MAKSNQSKADARAYEEMKEARDEANEIMNDSKSKKDRVPNYAKTKKTTGKSAPQKKADAPAKEDNIAEENGKVKAKTHVRKKKTAQLTNDAATAEIDAMLARIFDMETAEATPQKNENKQASKPRAKKSKGESTAVEKYNKDNVSVKERGPRAVSQRGARDVAEATGKIKIIPLGGLNEVGKNMTVIEYGDDIVIVDCGLGFPDEEMPGVDLVIPDTTYLEANQDRIRGLVITHGHEDHIGAIPYVLRNINPPIYGTRLTLGILKNKLKEVSLPNNPKLICVNSGDNIKLGKLSCEFIHVNHSIADACALAIRTPLGVILHSGDFKLDLTPIDGEIMDLTRLGEIGREGVLLLMCESTNAHRPGSTPSERKVGASLDYLFTMNKDKRIVIATFSSNVHRVQQIIDNAYRHGRKVAITGRSMLNVVGAAMELGYMNVPDGVLIDLADIKRYRPEEITLITTGSQGEPMSALYRMAFSEHRDVQLGANDVVILSSSAIPGNEKLIGKIINELLKLGAKVIQDASVEVHVSGHACQDEIKLLMALTKPQYFMPIHGEYKHMAANRELALHMGMDPRSVFVSDIGKVLEIDKYEAKWGGTVPAGKVLVDGYGVGDVGSVVLRDRKLLSQDGLIVIVASVSVDGGYVLAGPDIVSRGFVYVRDSEDLMEEMKQVAIDSMMSSLSKTNNADWFKIKNRVKDDMAKFIFTKTRRRPMIIPIIMNI